MRSNESEFQNSSNTAKICCITLCISHSTRFVLSGTLKTRDWREQCGWKESFGGEVGFAGNSAGSETTDESIDLELIFILDLDDDLIVFFVYRPVKT